MKAKKKISYDEIYACTELASQFSQENIDFIKKITTYPNLVIEFGHPALYDLATKLIHASEKDESLKQLLAYDTTFQLGDFYVSTVTMRNCFVEGDPVFPVAFMLHERKFMKDHTSFLNSVLSKVKFVQGDEKKAVTTIPFAVDREQGILHPLK